MRGGWSQRLGRFVLGLSLCLAITESGPARGDDSGFLGRLFRFGGPPASGRANSAGDPAADLPYGRDPGTAGGFVAPSASPAAGPHSLPTFGGLPETPPVVAGTGPAPRLTPKPRVSPAVTSADPVLTRFALGRSNDGSAFGMFLQVFADGTVIDSEGVHRLRPSELKPITDAVQSGELYRLRGHCGAPATDFIEYVHIIVYERRFGRLMAHSFSYSGNPQGCDHAIRHLHTALENLQAKLSRPPMIESPGASAAPGPVGASPLVPAASSAYPLNAAPAPAIAPGRQGVLSPVGSPYPAPTGEVIPLTPAEPGR